MTSSRTRRSGRSLTGGAVVNHNHADAAGTVPREFHPVPPGVRRDRPADDGADRRADARPRPPPGRRACPASPPPPPGAGKGATAFQWSVARLRRGEPSARTASGGVVVAHKARRADQPLRPPYRRRRDGRLPLPSEPKVATTKLAAGGPAGNPPAAAALQLKGLSAVGNTITRGGRRGAGRPDRVRPDRRLIATRNPAAFSDGTAGTTTAEEVQEHPHVAPEGHEDDARVR